MGSSPAHAGAVDAGTHRFCPEWSFVAVDRTGDRPRVAGFLLASRYEQDWAALGWREGYIDQLGVLSAWRETRVADALILASMWAQKRDGMDRSGTGVGSANHTGALAVYDSLGFARSGRLGCMRSKCDNRPIFWNSA